MPERTFLDRVNITDFELRQAFNGKTQTPSLLERGRRFRLLVAGKEEGLGIGEATLFLFTPAN